MRAPNDPRFRAAMLQPPCSDGTRAALKIICVVRRAIQGGPPQTRIGTC